MKKRPVIKHSGQSNERRATVSALADMDPCTLLPSLPPSPSSPSSSPSSSLVLFLSLSLSLFLLLFPPQLTRKHLNPAVVSV